MNTAWIKLRKDLATDLSVISMAEALDEHEFTVVGRLHHFWSWADSQTKDGFIPGITARWIDRYVQREGFVDALVDAGWLQVDDSGVTIPGFQEHMSESAKKRAEKTKRQRDWRERKNAACSGDVDDAVDASVDAPTSTSTSTREEKRREEPSLRSGTTPAKPKRRTNIPVEHMVETMPGLSPTVAEDFLVHRKAKRAPLTETAWQGICRNVAQAQAPPDDALTLAMARGWQGFQADWWANAQRQTGGGHETRQRDETRISPAERTRRAIERRRAGESAG